MWLMYTFNGCRVLLYYETCCVWIIQKYPSEKLVPLIYTYLYIFIDDIY